MAQLAVGNNRPGRQGSRAWALTRALLGERGLVFGLYFTIQSPIHMILKHCIHEDKSYAYILSTRYSDVWTQALATHGNGR